MPHHYFQVTVIDGELVGGVQVPDTLAVLIAVGGTKVVAMALLSLFLAGMTRTKFFLCCLGFNAQVETQLRNSLYMKWNQSFQIELDPTVQHYLVTQTCRWNGGGKSDRLNFVLVSSVFQVALASPTYGIVAESKVRLEQASKPSAMAKVQYHELKNVAGQVVAIVCLVISVTQKPFRGLRRKLEQDFTSG